MRLCLAVMCRDEAPLLRLHAPVWIRSAWDGFIALDGGSEDDSAQVLRDFGATVYSQTAPSFPPVGWENELVERVEAAGYSHVLRLDPDELLHPEGVDRIRQVLNADAEAVWLPRYNFMGDRIHYADVPPFYPDVQMKVWALHRSVRYQRAIDSVPNVSACGLRSVFLPDVHLYHYSFVKPMADYLRKRVPLERQARGEAVNGYEPNANAPYPATPVPFTGAQPLDPHVVGFRAPYTSADEEIPF